MLNLILVYIYAGMDHFPGKVESSRSFSHLQHSEGFDMFG
jgi:hypothetical protein